MALLNSSLALRNTHALQDVDPEAPIVPVPVSAVKPIALIDERLSVSLTVANLISFKLCEILQPISVLVCLVNVDMVTINSAT